MECEPEEADKTNPSGHGTPVKVGQESISAQGPLQLQAAVPSPEITPDGESELDKALQVGYSALPLSTTPSPSLIQLMPMPHKPVRRFLLICGGARGRVLWTSSCL